MSPFSMLLTVGIIFYFSGFWLATSFGRSFKSILGQYIEPPPLVFYLLGGSRFGMLKKHIISSYSFHLQIMGIVYIIEAFALRSVIFRFTPFAFYAGAIVSFFGNYLICLFITYLVVKAIPYRLDEDDQ